jgi:hypothetical protein
MLVKPVGEPDEHLYKRLGNVPKRPGRPARDLQSLYRPA